MRRRNFIKKTGRFRRVWRKRPIRRRGFKKNVRRIVAKMSETKFQQIEVASEGIPDVATGGLTYFAGLIEQGTDRSERIGRRVRSRYFGFKGLLGWNDYANGGNQVLVRVMLVRGRQLNFTPIGDGPQTFNAPWNLEKFVVYFDKYYTLGASYGLIPGPIAVTRSNQPSQYNVKWGRWNKSTYIYDGINAVDCITSPTTLFMFCTVQDGAYIQGRFFESWKDL